MNRTPAAAAVLLCRAHPHRAPTIVYPAEWWNDDLEWGLGWTILSGDGTPTIERVTAAKRSGTYGLRLRTDDAAPGALDTAIGLAVALLPSQDYLTFDAWLRAPIKSDTTLAGVHLAFFAGGHKYRGAFFHRLAANKWQYSNAAGADTDVPGGAYPWADNTWIHISLQIRVSTQRYGTVTWPGGSADLSAQALYDDGALAGSGARLQLLVQNVNLISAALDTDDLQLLHSPNP